MCTGAKTRLARTLRREMTPAEHYLWTRLRRRQLAGCRFRRQHPLGPYIADFACLERQLRSTAPATWIRAPMRSVTTGFGNAGSSWCVAGTMT